MFRRIDWALALRKFKRATGTKQKDLAEKVGVEPSTVSRWFNGSGVPDERAAPEVHAILEQNLSKTEAARLQEINLSEELIVAMDSQSRPLALSKGFRDLMLELGIETWNTDWSEDGMLRVIKVKVRAQHDEAVKASIRERITTPRADLVFLAALVPNIFDYLIA